MRTGPAGRLLLSIAMTICGVTGPAFAAPNCNNFFSNADGSWSPTHPIVIAGPSSQTVITPSDKFQSWMPGLSGRIARSLNVNCRYQRAQIGVRNIPRIP